MLTKLSFVQPEADIMVIQNFCVFSSSRV